MPWKELTPRSQRKAFVWLAPRIALGSLSSAALSSAGEDQINPGMADLCYIKLSWWHNVTNMTQNVLPRFPNGC
jgi:hypothetical protein